MEIELRNVYVNKNSIKPQLLLEANFEYLEQDELPLSISGMLLSEDRIELAKIIEHPMIPMSDQFNLAPNDFSHQAGNPNAKVHYTFLCELDQQSINHIELIRLKNEKKDVNLAFVFNIHFITTSYRDRKSGHSYNLINKKFRSLRKNYRISESDWIQHFSKELKIGEYILIEIKEVTLDKINDRFKSLNNESSYGNLKQRMIKSHGIIEEMKSRLQKGEWDLVMRHSREFFELFKLGNPKKIKPELLKELKQLHKERNGSEVGFNELYDAILKMFEYTSKFIHEKDQRDQLHIKPIAKSEDAYFTFSLCINLMNLIVNKI